jgi:hypothetical protein
MRIKRMLWIVVFATACGAGTEQSQSSNCAKCDDPQRIDLTTLPIEVPAIAECWVVPDPEPTITHDFCDAPPCVLVKDPADLVDEVFCRRNAMPQVVTVQGVYVNLKDANGDYVTGKNIDDQAPGTVVSVGRVWGDKWPLTLNLTAMLDTGGELESSDLRQLFFAKEWPVANAAAAPVESPFALASPVTFWPIHLIAERDATIDQLSVSVEHRFPLVSDELGVAGPTIRGEIDASIYVTTTTFPRAFYLAVAATGETSVTANIFVTSQTFNYEATGTISEPGFYTVNSLGELRPSTHNDFQSTPAEPVDPADPADPSDPVDPVDPSDPADPSDPVDPGDPAPPCNNLCTETQVCVAEFCIERDAQIDGAKCVGNDNAQCALDFVCITHLAEGSGECRERSKQTTSWNGSGYVDASCDTDDDADCADNFVCIMGALPDSILGSCKERSKQTKLWISGKYVDSLCDNDRNGDCADEHVCIMGADLDANIGRCKVRSEQKPQWDGSKYVDSFCDNDDNSECADDHVCVMAANADALSGYCKLRSNQKKLWDGSKYVDSACDAGQDTDCADGLTCTEGFCK